MKKILHVVAAFGNGGIENSVKDICNNIDNSIYDIHLLILSNNKLEVLPQLSSHVKVYIFPIKIYNSGFINSLNCLLKICGIIRVIKKVSPDIIHDHIFPYHSIPLLMAIKLSGIKCQHIHTIHTTGLHYKSQSISHKLKLVIEELSYKLMHTDIVCISPVIKDFVEHKMQIHKSKLHFIPNGVNTEKYNKDLFLSLNNIKYFDIAYVARLVNGKNHITILKAIVPLITKYSNIRLILLGDGELKTTLYDFVASHKIENNVIFKGDIRDIPKELANCDIGVFPSEYEGFSLAIVEMMSMGLPIICSNIPAFTSVFNTDEVIFCDVFDSIEWSKNIEVLYTNSNIREDYKLKSKNIAKRYSLELSISSYNVLYNSYN